MAARQVFEPQQIQQRFEHSELTLWIVEPRLAIHRVRGVLDVPSTQVIIDRLTPFRETAVGAFSFADWFELESYDSQAREMLTRWLLKYRKAVHCAHILQKSKLVAMGVSVANIVVGGKIKAHFARLSWDQAIIAASSQLGLDPYIVLRDYRRMWVEGGVSFS